jgi:hypothetical protein
MEADKKIKSSISIVVLAVFLVGIIAGFAARQNNLVPPASAALSALPVTSISNPTQITPDQASFSVSPVSGASCYKFTVRQVVAGKAASDASFVSDCVSATNYKIPSNANLASNTVFQMTASACVSGGVKCSAESGPLSYFTIVPAAAAATTVLPKMYATDASGNVFGFDSSSNAWMQIKNSSGPQIFATTSDNKTFSFNGSAWVQINAPSQPAKPAPAASTSVVSQIVNAVANTFNNIVSGVVSVYSRIVNSGSNN